MVLLYKFLWRWDSQTLLLLCGTGGEDMTTTRTVSYVETVVDGIDLYGDETLSC